MAMIPFAEEPDTWRGPEVGEMENRAWLSRCVAGLLILFLSGVIGTAAQAPITLHDIDLHVQRQMLRSSIPGLSYVIVQASRVSHMAAFGTSSPHGAPMASTTPVYIGSVGKSYTALAARQLVNTGSLDLDWPVARLIPTFSSADFDAFQAITVRHLLEHTSGFSTEDGNNAALYNPRLSSDELVSMITRFQLHHQPGTVYEYSNLNYIVLGRVVELTAALPFADYVERFIFEPLRMQHSYYDEEEAEADGLSAGYRYFFGVPVAVAVDEPSGAAAAGFAMSSASDMANYLIALLNGGWFGGESVVDPHANYAAGNSARERYNALWQPELESPMSGNTQIFRGGWVTSSACIVWMPDERIGVAVLANSYPAQWLPAKDASGIALDVLRLYTGNPPSPDGPVLAQLYAMVDIVLVIALALVVARAWTVTRRQRHPIGNAVVDFSLAALGFCVVPPALLGCPIDSIFACWSRFFLQIPDIAGMTLATSILLAIIALLRVLLSRSRPQRRAHAEHMN